MRVRRGRTLAILLTLMAGAAGCDIPLAPLPVTLTSAPSPSAPAATPIPGGTSDPTPSPTPSPTLEPTPTPSPIPTPTPEATPTPTPTPTPLGTLIVGTSPEATGAWTSATAMARSRMGHVVMTQDNRLVVAGGFPTEVLEGYRPSSDAWEEQDLSASFLAAAPRVNPGQYFSCGGTVGTNRFVVAGGTDGSEEIYPPRVYTLEEGFRYTVSFGASLPFPRFAVAGATIGNKLYVAGGLWTRSVTLGGVFQTTALSNGLSSYDVTSDTWSTLSGLPIAVSGATAVALNGQLCVLGGLLESGEPTSEVQVFKPDLNRWVSDPSLGAIPPMRTARHSAAATVLNGKIYVLGGVTESRTATTAAEVYDPETRTWQSLPPMPFARSLHAAVAFGGKVYVLGGNNAQGQPQRTVEAYTP